MNFFCGLTKIKALFKLNCSSNAIAFLYPSRRRRRQGLLKSRKSHFFKRFASLFFIPKYTVTRIGKKIVYMSPFTLTKKIHTDIKTTRKKKHLTFTITNNISIP
jgi:tRNA G37 N-methylase TrmD